MDHPDHQCRFGGACRPTCDRTGALVPPQPPAPPHQYSDLGRSQRLLAAATVAATFVVALNALVQALNVLAAWLGHGR